MALDPTAASAEAKLVVDFRAGVLFRSALMRAVLTQLPADTPSEIRAITSGRIEQILILAGGELRDPHITVLLRANRAYNWQSFPSGQLTSITREGITYRHRVGEPSTCYRTLDDRTLLVAPESTIARPLLIPGRPGGPHAWDDAWRRLGPATTRLALDGQWFDSQTRGVQQALAAQLTPFLPLFNRPQVYLLTIDNLDNPRLKLTVICPNEASAGEVATSLRLLVDQARDFLRVLRQGRALSSLIRDPEEAVLLTMIQQTIRSTRVEPQGSDVRLTADFGGVRTAALLTALSIPAAQAGREAARQAQSVNNLRFLGVAFQDYKTTHGTFPPAVVLGPDGKTPHSWRVAILPYLQEEALFRAYKLDESWDGPTNIKLIERMPQVFHDPSDTAAAPGVSSYLAPVGPTTCFPPGRAEGLRVADFRDGTSTTIMVIEARRDIPWTRPEDIAIDPVGPLPAFGGNRPGKFSVLFADGSVKTLTQAIDPKVLRGLLTPNGAEVIERDDY